MKLWDILKAENKGKKYKDNTGAEYELDIDNYGTICLYNSDEVVIFAQSELLELEFEEVGTWTGWERVANNELYYYIDSDDRVESKVECSDSVDGKLNAVSNYFSNERVAERVLRENKMLRDMLKFYDINDGNVDWEDGCYKYCIGIPYNSKRFYTIDRVHKNKVFGVVYFSSVELAKKCITEVLKKYYGTGRKYIDYTWEIGNCDIIK